MSHKPTNTKPEFYAVFLSRVFETVLSESKETTERTLRMKKGAACRLWAAPLFLQQDMIDTAIELLSAAIFASIALLFVAAMIHVLIAAIIWIEKHIK